MIGEALKYGDQIIYTLPSISSVLSIDSFIDDIIGETDDRYFDKQFCYALEGLFYSDWQELDNIALEEIEIDIKRSYIFKIKYIRNGIDNTGILILNNIQINSTNFTYDSGFEYKNSNFVKFFEAIDSDCIDWALNVLKKIYLPGELAIFIERGKILQESLLQGFRIIEDGNYRLLEDNSLRLIR